MKNTSRLIALLVSMAVLHSIPAQAQTDQEFCEEEAAAAGMMADQDIANYVAQCMENIQLSVTTDIMPGTQTETESSE